MRYKLNTLAPAAEDIKEIKKYLAGFYQNTAKKFIRLYKQKTYRLRDMPYSCERYTDDPDYRRMVVGDYLVFYMVDDEKRIVDIHRVLHGSRDILRHLAVKPPQQESCK